MFSIFVRILLSTWIAPVIPIFIPALFAISTFGDAPVDKTQKSASISTPFCVIAFIKLFPSSTTNLITLSGLIILTLLEHFLEIKS